MEKRYIGIDLHRNRFTCCIRLENERTYLTEWELEDLGKFVKKLRPADEVAVEITGNTRLFHDAVAGHVARVVVVNTSQFRVIRQSVKKTDPNDARTLALYLSKDMLPEVRMKDKEHGQLASLTQTRDTLVKLRTALKNKVNNILSARGLNLPKEALSSEKRLTEVLSLPFDEIVQIELRVIVEQIRSLNRSIAELEKTIGEEGSKLEGHKGLSSIKGIGKITGAILLSVIGDVNDFADEGHEGAAWRRQGDHRAGQEVSGCDLPDAQEQVGVRRLSELRAGGGVMKALWNPPPGIGVFDSRYAVRLAVPRSRTVLGGKGSLRRGTRRRALASCAPFCIRVVHDGRLRRESKTTQLLRLAKDENQIAVDKT